jgi:hypothetical protein
MGRAAERLFQDPAQLGSLFKFGPIWRKDRYEPWVPRKRGAETTGVGHYVSDNLPWLTREVYERAVVGNSAKRGKAIDYVWDGDKPFYLPRDHPYAGVVRGPLIPPDEYASDVYDEVMLKVDTNVGVEIGPVARLFHFHMQLDVRHLSKCQLDYRAFNQYFLACWTGLLCGGDLAIRAPDGALWIPQHERFHPERPPRAHRAAHCVMCNV